MKELELVSSQDQRRLTALQTENESLLKQLTDERTRNIAIDDQLQRKEEVIEEHQESHEKTLKAKVKEVKNMQDELEIYKRRLSESQLKMKQAG